MNAGIAMLVLGYVLSQFYRAFLAVLTPTLERELGVGAEDLAVSSGLWFVAFALMQIPVGWALDRFGPARTVAVLLAIGGAGGAAVFALASGPWSIHIAMVLIGIGCSPVLMGSYYIFARAYPPALFGTLAGVVVGIGSLGNILGAAPLVWVIKAAGWRETLWGLAVVTLAVAALTRLWVRDPAPLPRDGSVPQGRLRDVLALPALWAILPLLSVNYAAVAAIRGLWAAPYLDRVHGADSAMIGWATLAMGLAMVAGSFLMGPLAKRLGGLKRAVLIVNAGLLLVLAALWLLPGAGLGTVIVALALMGFFGSSYPILMAHGRAFLPPHLVGRGVTFLNMVSIGGVGLYQFGSRAVYQAGADLPPQAAFGHLFLFFLIPLALGLAIYLTTREARDA
ncbi:MFS transporter [Paracoccus sp. p4-l81]|uniref:MFS transporter n=1 Tax=unclassified Paracoccus (in: a-proteobacteria) TaxID=2688777 RepID=UPI0035B96054